MADKDDIHENEEEEQKIDKHAWGAKDLQKVENLEEKLFLKNYIFQGNAIKCHVTELRLVRKAFYGDQ